MLVFSVGHFTGTTLPYTALSQLLENWKLLYVGVDGDLLPNRRDRGWGTAKLNISDRQYQPGLNANTIALYFPMQSF